jgi:UbiD family decarboxylase
MFQDLQSFVKFLESKRDLVRVRAEVDPDLEVTEIADRAVRAEGPALLFENVRGSSFPLLLNVLGARRRIVWALGREPGRIGEELARFVESLNPPRPKNLWRSRSVLLNLRNMRPRRMWRAPVRGSANRLTLSHLPITKSWPQDGGRFITFPLVITKGPADGRQNMGIYRMHVYDAMRTGMHWQIQKGGGFHFSQAEARGQDLDVVVALGADPALMLAGILPLPEGIDELAFSGYLRGRPTAVTLLSRARLMAPARAEFLLEGSVHQEGREMEGPFGDHFGHYSAAAPFPVFHIRNIFHRPGAIFPAAVVGKPPKEDKFMGEAVQELTLPLLKLIRPELSDLWAYYEAGFHNLLAAAVHQRYAKEGIKTALGLLGEGQLSLTKCVILVDRLVNVKSFPAVLRMIARNFNPAEDFILLPGTSQDTLDFTSFKMNLGSKMIIDATSTVDGKIPPAPTAGPDPQAVRSTDSRITHCICWEETLLVVQVKGEGRTVLEALVKHPVAASAKIICAVSQDVPLADPELLLWGIFTRFDCARDIVFSEVSLVGACPRYRGPLGIDATWKPGYPAPLEMDPEIVKKVDQRWKQYGIN